MKIGNEILPIDIFANKVQKFISTATLMKMSAVSKNWQAVVNNKSVWERRLNQIGIGNSTISKLKEIYQIETSKSLYFFLTGDKSFEGLLTAEAYLPRKGWCLITLPKEDLDYINSSLSPINTIEEETFNRETEFLKMIRSFPLFNSLPAYLCYSGDNSLCKPKKIDIKDILGAEQMVLDSFKSFCADDELYSSFQCWNAKEIPHPQALAFMSGVNFATQPRRCTRNLIKHHDKLIGILEEQAFIDVSDPIDDDNFESSLEFKKKINFKEKRIIEINKSTWKILSYSITADEFLQPALIRIFENFQLKIAHCKKSSKELKTFIKDQALIRMKQAPTVFNQIKQVLTNVELSLLDIVQVKFELNQLIKLKIPDALIYKLKLLRKSTCLNDEQLLEEYSIAIENANSLAHSPLHHISTFMYIEVYKRLAKHDTSLNLSPIIKGQWEFVDNSHNHLLMRKISLKQLLNILNDNGISDTSLSLSLEERKAIKWKCNILNFKLNLLEMFDNKSLDLKTLYLELEIFKILDTAPPSISVSNQDQHKAGNSIANFKSGL